MSKYRINVRFDTDDPKQAEAVKFLQSLEHSRNAFIVSAVLDTISGKSAANSISLEAIRKIIREELAGGVVGCGTSCFSVGKDRTHRRRTSRK